MVQQLTGLKEQYSVFHKQIDELNTIQNKLQHKLTTSHGELQALKGHALNTNKYKKQLEAKCSTLETALELVSNQAPTIVKLSPGPQRTRAELRLRQECQKKVVHCIKCYLHTASFASYSLSMF